MVTILTLWLGSGNGNAQNQGELRIPQNPASHGDSDAPPHFMHLPAGLESKFPKGFKEPFPIRIIPKDRLLPAATIEDMINRSGVFDAKRSGLPRGLCNQGKDYQLFGVTPV